MSDRRNDYAKRVSIFGGTSLYDVYEDTVGKPISYLIDGWGKSQREYSIQPRRSYGYETESSQRIVRDDYDLRERQEIARKAHELDLSVRMLKSDIDKYTNFFQESLQKGKENHIKKNYVEAAEHFEDSINYLMKLRNVIDITCQRLNAPFKDREKIDEDLKKLKFSKYRSLADQCLSQGDYDTAKNYLSKALSSSPEMYEIGKRILGRAEMYDFLKKGIESNDEITAMQFFTMAVNKGKENLLGSKEETKFHLKSDVSLCEGLKFLSESIIETDKIKIEEAKQKFEEASVSIPGSYLAYKLLCDSYHALLDGDDGNRKFKREKASEILKAVKQQSYIDQLLAQYFKYILTKYIDKKPESASQEIGKQLKKITKQSKKYSKTELDRIDQSPKLFEFAYSSLPTVCPKCHIPTTYVELSETEYQCVKCLSRIRVRA